MTDDSTMPPTGSPGSGWVPAGVESRRAFRAAVLVVLGGVLAGVIAGLLWAAIAPRVQYQVYTLKPPTAYATNPETSAFIAADGSYCFIALGAGLLVGLLAYLFAIRRYRAVPMAGLIIGTIAAAFIMAWIGHWASGGLGFDHVLATSKPGAFLYAPISLGARGALAFWPLGAAAVVGGIELAGTVRARRQAPDNVPMPGMDSFGWPDRRPEDDGRDSGRPGAGSQLDGGRAAGDGRTPGGGGEQSGGRSHRGGRHSNAGRGWWQQPAADQERETREASAPGWSAQPPGWSQERPEWSAEPHSWPAQPPPGQDPGRR